MWGQERKRWWSYQWKTALRTAHISPLIESSVWSGCTKQQSLVFMTHFPLLSEFYCIKNSIWPEGKLASAKAASSPKMNHAAEKTSATKVVFIWDVDERYVIFVFGLRCNERSFCRHETVICQIIATDLRTGDAGCISNMNILTMKPHRNAVLGFHWYQVISYLHSNNIFQQIIKMSLRDCIIVFTSEKNYIYLTIHILLSWVQ